MRSAMWLVAMAMTLCIPSFAQESDYQRGLRNYRAVVAGQKKLEDLSELEKGEVLAIARIYRARNSDDGSEECSDARQRAESTASELADYARRLRNCAESNKLSDDCSIEFRRVRNAHSEYESAVSNVSSYCR
jgi:hypothetical protein